MALIRCIECGREVSDEAKIVLHEVTRLNHLIR